MSKWFYYFRNAPFLYFFSLLWITILLKINVKVSRPAKITLELLEYLFKNKEKFHIQNDILTIDAKINEQKVQFNLRWMSTDILVFKQIILDRELDPIVKLFTASGITPKVMIDAGANIGLSSMFTRLNFPSVKILCIEPNKENIAMIHKNLGYANYQILQKALWFQKGYLEEQEGDGAWGIHMVEIEEESNGAVESTSLTDVMQQFKLETIDYLKIDIEGAEEQIFYQDPQISQALDKVTCISIEPHSVEFEKFIIQYLRDAGFQVSQSGELVIGFKR
ncbi:methyltransferase, FkbM family [Belliella baltica DSM 15883]|uniref:Methyltransferase, FkbM family n=1 Tax=Belliella baltica (strain DSM 15883 / CIP 108006 / LMG 21964 / BA134) TaxID=866536 RepID=I3Z757_BELBD|nr:FkbM family methyltransferase [Belliella baltica]AFL85075.1 methyltransferase, FkbM family [Belliella baltica DSM 15883]